jgi:hypothetical protein
MMPHPLLAPIGKAATSCDIALRLLSRLIFLYRRWSGYPSIAFMPINPGIEVMAISTHAMIDFE